MSLINIAGLTDVTDFSYRYKMPSMQAKVEGRGNGIKTVLVNIVELSQALNREAPEITKFFGCELGSQTTYATDTDRAVVNGAIETRDLQTHLRKYIEHFVLCKNCHLPETQYKIKADQLLQKCLACGSKDVCDMAHKLTSFILSQHKKKKDEEKKAGKEKEKKEKKERKALRAAGVSEDATDELGNGEDAAAEGSPKEKKKDKKEKKEKKEKDGDKKKKKKERDSEEGEEDLEAADLDDEDETLAIGE